MKKLKNLDLSKVRGGGTKPPPKYIGETEKRTEVKDAHDRYS